MNIRDRENVPLSNQPLARWVWGRTVVPSRIGDGLSRLADLGFGGVVVAPRGAGRNYLSAKWMSALAIAMEEAASRDLEFWIEIPLDFSEVSHLLGDFPRLGFVGADLEATSANVLDVFDPACCDICIERLFAPHEPIISGVASGRFQGFFIGSAYGGGLGLPWCEKTASRFLDGSKGDLFKQARRWMLRLRDESVRSTVIDYLTAASDEMRIRFSEPVMNWANDCGARIVGPPQQGGDDPLARSFSEAGARRLIRAGYGEAQRRGAESESPPTEGKPWVALSCRYFERGGAERLRRAADTARQGGAERFVVDWIALDGTANCLADSMAPMDCVLPELKGLSEVNACLAGGEGRQGGDAEPLPLGNPVAELGIASKWRVEQIEENVFPLAQCEYELAGRPWAGPISVYDLARSLSLVDEEESSVRNAEVKLRFRFHVGQAPPIAVERCLELRIHVSSGDVIDAISLNGAMTDLGAGAPSDLPGLTSHTLALSACEGENVLEATLRGAGSGFGGLWILTGRFGVLPSGGYSAKGRARAFPNGDWSLMACPGKAERLTDHVDHEMSVVQGIQAFEDGHVVRHIPWTAWSGWPFIGGGRSLHDFGFPFFGGRVRLTSGFRLLEPSGPLSAWRRAVFCLGKTPRVAWAELEVNGKKAGSIGLDPFRCEITDLLKPGEYNEVVVEAWFPWLDALAPFCRSPLLYMVHPRGFSETPRILMYE